MRVGIDFRRAPFWRDCSRLIRRAFPRYATCIPTMHVGWKPLRADARARFLALSPCQSFLLRPTSAWFIFHLLSTTCSGEIPIFLSAFRPQMSVGRIRTSTPYRDLYEFRNFPTFFHTPGCTRETPSHHNTTARTQQYLMICLAVYSIRAFMLGGWACMHAQ